MRRKENKMLLTWEKKGTALQGRTLRFRRLHNFWSGTTQWKCWWAGIWIIRPVGFALNSLSGARSFTRTGTRRDVKLICRVDTLVQCVVCCCYGCPWKKHVAQIERRIHSQASLTHNIGTLYLDIDRYGNCLTFQMIFMTYTVVFGGALIPGRMFSCTFLRFQWFGT